jgi:hypothetical protein
VQDGHLSLVRAELLEPEINLNDTENLSSYATENALHFHYKERSINAIQGNSRYLF